MIPLAAALYGSGEPRQSGGEEKHMSAVFDETVLRQIDSEVRTIKAEYRGRVPEESIDFYADESIQRLADSRVPQFVPLFVGRFTRERLRELVASGEATEPARSPLGARQPRGGAVLRTAGGLDLGPLVE